MWWRAFLSRIRPRELDASEPEPAETESDTSAEAPWLGLQRTLGNRAVQRLVSQASTRGEPGLLSSGSAQGEALDPKTRHFMESRFGEDFSGVRVHANERAASFADALGAEAFSVGDDVHFAGGKYDPQTEAGGALLAHELTHVVQQRRRGAAINSERALSTGTDRAEREAEQVSRAVVERGPVEVEAAPEAPIARQPAPTPPTAKGSTADWPGLAPKVGPPPPYVIFEDPNAATPRGARKALDEYWKMAPGNRRTAFEFSYPKGSIARVLKALSPDDAAGPYREAVGELLLWVEGAETRVASGKTDEEMAEAEAKFVHAESKKKAEAKLGGPATVAEIEKVRRGEQESRSFHHPATKTRWERLSPAKQTAWTARGNKAIADIVAHAAKAHPKLKLTAAEFKLAFHEIDKNSPGALAQAGEVGGRPVAEVGFEFVEAVEVNPAYALSTVVHELFGHREFDDPSGGTYQLALFQKAGPKMPGYTPSPSAEAASYGYHESEIYSLLRELPYWTPVAAADKKFEHLNPDPRVLVAAQIAEIKGEWEPTLAVALMHGLYKRISPDPRIEAMALRALENSIRSKFTAKEASEILK